MYTLPSFVIPTSMLPFSLLTAVLAVGLFISIPVSFTKLVVTRKKINRIKTMSIKGAILSSND